LFWLKRLLGRRHAQSDDQRPIADSGRGSIKDFAGLVGSDAERALWESLGKTIVDDRPDWERRLEQEVRSDIGGEDERYARDLCDLLRAGDEAAARAIGERLYANGGHRRMVRVCLRVKALGGDARTLERYAWDGVGEWRG
jgi:hypothetical protein